MLADGILEVLAYEVAPGYARRGFGHLVGLSGVGDAEPSS